MVRSKSMTERREILRSFLAGDVPVMVATGVLGRGVDLLSVKQVIVFDMPNSIKEYVRLEWERKVNQSYLLMGENKNLFPDLVDTLKSSGASIPPELSNLMYTIHHWLFLWW
ncbi:unnamed protein product [Cuscuta epithymum]|uniref:Helicase C-terminal domain-containing protein n=1 Tax=Cuscuta epithymum TaxID=186058 RepID=A0AAV0DPK7_9ASTE|nr:unnamed protein product [Cuscuta epithymum]CAH9142531.1 unnamed protein product [Cuscuta epithymum]